MNCPECKEGTLEEDNFDERTIECDTCGKRFVILEVPKEGG